jgi:hypothetical protein
MGQFDNNNKWRSCLAVTQLAAAGVWIFWSTAAAASNQDEIATIRADVQGSQPQAAASQSSSSQAAPSQSNSSSSNRNGYDSQQDQVDQDWGSLFFNGGWAIVGATLLAPCWIPRAILHDDSREAHFPRFPYDNTQGYLTSDAWLEDFSASKLRAVLEKNTEPSASDGSATEPTGALPASPWPGRPERNWGCQFRVDYLNDFHNLDVVAAQMLLETTSRFGADASVQYFNERLFPTGNDHLFLGDCNVTYRFAQHPCAQMRIGLGMNWLGDTSRPDFGFNFTYGGDFFPVKPWVLSAEIDWGTLGNASLFRLRTTAGLMLDRFQPYVGYEYLSIGSTQCNFLIAGLSVWF